MLDNISDAMRYQRGPTVVSDCGGIVSSRFASARTLTWLLSGTYDRRGSALVAEPSGTVRRGHDHAAPRLLWACSPSAARPSTSSGLATSSRCRPRQQEIAPMLPQGQPIIGRADKNVIASGSSTGLSGERSTFVLFACRVGRIMPTPSPRRRLDLRQLPSEHLHSVASG